MYTVPGNCTPLGWQITEGSPGQTWQAWGGSFLLLPRRHALSSRWLWTFNHNMCENRLEEFQGSATSPLFTPPLFQNTWPCVQLLCAERNAPCQRDLAIDKAKLQHLQRHDRAMIRQIRKTLSPPGPMSYLCGLALRIWTSFWRREDSDGMDMWNAPMVQLRQPLTYKLMESMALGGPKWHGSSWQTGIVESGSSRLSTLMIDVPGVLVWDLPCMRQASYLEGGPLMWMLPLYLHFNQKSELWYMSLGSVYSLIITTTYIDTEENKHAPQ